MIFQKIYFFKHFQKNATGLIKFLKYHYHKDRLQLLIFYPLTYIRLWSNLIYLFSLVESYFPISFVKPNTSIIYKRQI